MTLSIWDVLGISPTKDIRIIRRAYAALSVKHHPEDYPERWREINRAYRAALDFARNTGASLPEPDVGEPVTAATKDARGHQTTLDTCGITIAGEGGHTDSTPGTDTDDEWFIFDIPAEKSGQDTADPSAQVALKEAEELIGHYYRRNRLSFWGDFLNSDTVREVVDHRAFLDGLAALIRGRGTILWPATLDFISAHFRLGDYASPADAGKYAELYGAVNNAGIYRQYIEKNEISPDIGGLREWWRKWHYLILIVAMFVFWQPVCFVIFAILVTRPYIGIPAAIAIIFFVRYRRKKQRNKAASPHGSQ